MKSQLRPSWGRTSLGFRSFCWRLSFAVVLGDSGFFPQPADWRCTPEAVLTPLPTSSPRPIHRSGGAVILLGD